jgi:hypothetical protein
MKSTLLIFLILFFSLSLQAEVYKINKLVFDSDEISFESNIGDGAFATYLVQKLNEEPR